MMFVLRVFLLIVGKRSPEDLFVFQTKKENKKRKFDSIQKEKKH